MSSRVMIDREVSPEVWLPGTWYRWHCPDCGKRGEWQPDRAQAMVDRLTSSCYKECVKAS